MSIPDPRCPARQLLMPALALSIVGTESTPSSDFLLESKGVACYVEVADTAVATFTARSNHRARSLTLRVPAGFDIDHPAHRSTGEVHRPRVRLR